jgi:hypothetical protein
VRFQLGTAVLTLTQKKRGQRGERLRFKVVRRGAFGSRSGKTWRQVTFKLNGRSLRKIRRGPFVVALRPQALRTGNSQIRVFVRDGRGQRARATFLLTSRKVSLGGRTVCVLNSRAIAGAAKPKAGKVKKSALANRTRGGRRLRRSPRGTALPVGLR